MKYPFCSSLALASALMALAPGVRADDFSDRFDLHGYGHQSYLQTDANTYLGADKHGSWDNNFLGLVLTATLNDKSKLWAQLQATTGEQSRFTWMFVDYQLTDNVRTHVGRVKMPLGLYNEIIDAKFLQVSALEPAMYQRAADMVHDAYHGVGFDYEQDIGGGHVLWQLYGGNVYDVDPPLDSRDRRAFGARVTWRTPVDGLRLMLSGYRTRVETLADQSMSNEDRVIASVDYVAGNYNLKAEYAKHDFMGVPSRSYYAQAGYSIGEKWTPYMRYDYVATDNHLSSDPSYFQKIAVLGFGYKIGSNIGLRVENHFNRGYGLAVASGEVNPGAGKRNWNLAVASVNFAF